MVEQRDDEHCRGCRISTGQEVPCGEIVKLDDNWILNHYQGSEAFLGWLVLQTNRHEMELTGLHANEASALGPNIQKIEKELRGYWTNTFPEDPIERVYVVYFFESAYEWPPSGYHLHFHLIARPRSFRGLQRNSDPLVAWRIHDVKTHPCFSMKYRPVEENVRNLMAHLKQRLQTPNTI